MKDLRHIFKYALPCLLTAALLLSAWTVCAFADEEYIPDEYYENIQSNDTQDWPQGQAIQASAGVVLDLDTGVFLYSKNCDRQLYPASITKIMTCLLVLENTKMDDVLTCTSAVYELDENASNVALQEGEQMTIRDALYTLMLESANDTANALAVHVGGSIAGFAQMMNDKAASLGCTGTHFSNPSGLTAEDHYTTAHDMALIAAAAYSRKAFRRICGTVEYEMGPTNMYEDNRYLVNHHRMLRGDSDYYMPWCTGGKTGFTEAAWNTLVTFGERDGKRLVCVLLHGNGADQNYLETIDLLNYGFDNFRHADLSGRFHDQTVAQAMHTDYLGRATALLAPQLQQPVIQFDGSTLVTIPQDADASQVTMVPDDTQPGLGEAKQIGFTYNGWPVGGLSASLQKVSLRMDYPWQVVAQVTIEGQTGDKEEEIRDTNDIVWQNVEEFADSTVKKIGLFVDGHRSAVILSAGLIAVVLLLLLLLLLLQSTNDYRSRKKMRAAREQALRREEEIDAMSALEIEEELRRAMAQEKESRETDDWKMDPNLQDLDLQNRSGEE